jgi:hypothetical protein
LPAIAVTPVGAPGAVAGVTELVVAEGVLVPTAFVAVTVKLYTVPLTSPVMVIGEPVLNPLNPPVFDVAVYVVIADPPLLAGAVNVIVAEPFPAVAETAVGASGTVTGVTEFDAVDDALVPIELVAVTVKVYAAPLTRPLIVIGAPLLDALNPPVFDVAVYVVIVDPPVLAGAVNEIVALPFPAVAETLVGAPGVVAGVTALLVPDGVLVPEAFVAVTVNVYAVPFVRPVIVIGDEPPVAVAPVLEVTVYDVIAEPPVLAGAVNEIVAEPLPATAVTPVGDPGAVEGVTALLATEDALVPTAFVAVTVKV